MVGGSQLTTKRVRSYQHGAEPLADGVSFRVWGPSWSRGEVVIDGRPTPIPLVRESDGFWSALVADVPVDARYKFRIDGKAQPLPDPASRYQPEGPHGWSAVVDPRTFAWTDADWKGATLDSQCIYELHIGSFSQAGTWRGAVEKLPALRDLGVSILEVMPVSEFPGQFGWGYDGVDLYAPSHLYGSPDDFRFFVDQAHALGLAVILDVVYNHFGPDGNYLDQFSPHYASKKPTEWGAGVNFDGEQCKPVRTFVAQNAAYWIDEFHLDGLRLDATQSVQDTSDNHIVAELTQAARLAAGGKSIVVVGENEPQHSRLVRPLAQGGYGLDGLWNDDFHHTARVAMTGRREAFYTDYLGRAQEFVSAAKYGFLFQGQRYAWQKAPRGQPTRGVPPEAFVCFLENHDQLANSVRGEHLCHLTTPGRHRAFTAMLLLGPWTPMLFQGQEWNSSNPFVYFAHHTGPLAEAVRKGRLEFLSQFPSCCDPDIAALIPVPSDPGTFERCRLNWQERTETVHANALAMHKDLLTLRRTDVTLSKKQQAGVSFDGAVLGNETLALRYFSEDGAADRLLVVNWGADQVIVPAPEPLLAPPYGFDWSPMWSSEDIRYGGCGRSAACTPDRGWSLAGHSAILFQPNHPAVSTVKDHDAS